LQRVARSDAPAGAEFFGPLTMTHVGLCTQDRPKNGPRPPQAVVWIEGGSLPWRCELHLYGNLVWCLQGSDGLRGPWTRAAQPLDQSEIRLTSTRGFQPPAPRNGYVAELTITIIVGDAGIARFLVAPANGRSVVPSFLVCDQDRRYLRRSMRARCFRVAIAIAHDPL